MLEEFTADRMRKMAHDIETKSVGREVTIRIPLLTAGAIIRPSIRRFFMEIEVAGGEVVFKENKRWTESDFYKISITGSPKLMKQVALHFADIFED
jgi:hypothetical protein